MECRNRFQRCIFLTFGDFGESYNSENDFDEIKNGKSMIYNVDISSDDIITKDMVSNLYLCNGFTLTVNAVNDAPVLLQPFEDLEILENSAAAAMVLRSM